MDEIDKDSLEDIFIPLFSESLYKEVKVLLERNQNYKLLRYLITIRRMASLVGEKSLINVEEDLFTGKLDKKVFLEKVIEE